MTSTFKTTFLSFNFVIFLYSEIRACYTKYDCDSHRRNTRTQKICLFQSPLFLTWISAMRIAVCITSPLSKYGEREKKRNTRNTKCMVVLIVQSVHIRQFF